MSTNPRADFYEAKRAAMAAKPRGVDHVGTDTIVAILLAVGFEEPATIARADGKPTRVFRVDAYNLLDEEQRAGRKVHRGNGQGVPGFITGTSLTDVARQVVPSYVRSKRTQGIAEITPTDYRYYLAATNPGSLIVPRGDEFAEHVDVITPDQIMERLR